MYLHIDHDSAGAEMFGMALFSAPDMQHLLAGLFFEQQCQTRSELGLEIVFGSVQDRKVLREAMTVLHQNNHDPGPLPRGAIGQAISVDRKTAFVILTPDIVTAMWNERPLMLTFHTLGFPLTLTLCYCADLQGDADGHRTLEMPPAASRIGATPRTVH